MTSGFIPATPPGESQDADDTPSDEESYNFENEQEHAPYIDNRRNDDDSDSYG